MLKIFIIDAIRRLSILVTHHKTDHYEAASLVAVFILAVDVRTIEHWPITNPKDHSFFLSHQLLFLHLLIFLFFPFRGFVFFVSLFSGWVRGLSGVGRLRPQPWLLASAAVPKIIDATHPIPVQRLWRRFIRKKPRFQVYDEHSMATTGPPSFSFSFFRRKKLLNHCFHSDKERKTKNYAKPFQKLNRPMLHFFEPRVHKIFRVELDWVANLITATQWPQIMITYWSRWPLAYSLLF